jgi:hypothetical protein
MAALNANAMFFIQWPNNAALTLIRRRRLHQREFIETPMHSQRRIWRAISQEINQATNFAPTSKQCRTKWNALKSGYENMKRLLNGNPEGYPTRTPTLHDERFHEELSDEFWTTERKYLLFNCLFH